MSADVVLAAALLAILLLAAMFSHRYAWWRRTVDYRHPRILMYHMVSAPRPGARFNKLRVSPAALERQLRWLRDNGWTFAFLSELAAPTARKTVVLTFDDGYRDNLTAAHPLLRKYQAKATLFPVVDRANRDWSITKKAHHNSGELAAEPKLTDDELKDMLASGVWELGAHTITHPLLTKLPEADRRTEIAGGKEALEGAFGVRVRSFAYPFGVFEAVDVDLAREACFQFAVTTRQGVSTDLDSDALTLRRVVVSGKDGDFSFRLRLRTGWRSAGWRSAR